MALIASIGFEPLTKRQKALQSIKGLETLLKRTAEDATAEEVVAAITQFFKDELEVAGTKKKAKKAE